MDNELIIAIHLLTEEVAKLRGEITLQKGKSILLKERAERKLKAAELMSRLEKGDC